MNTSMPTARAPETAVNDNLYAIVQRRPLAQVPIDLLPHLIIPSGYKPAQRPAIPPPPPGPEDEYSYPPSPADRAGRANLEGDAR